MRCRVGSRPSRLLPRSAVAAIVSGTLITASGAAAFGGEGEADRTAPGQPPLVQVAAVFVMARPSSITAVTVMQAEAARIWGRYSVAIDWREPGPALDPSVRFVVIVSPDTARCVPWRADRADAFACFPLVPEGNARPVIKVFPDRVRRLVDRGVASICRRCLESWIERLTATLLGRALAHEIGHYLLGAEHSGTGLMKANIDAAELFTQEGDTLSLTNAQIASLGKAPRR
jgi:hypothetical protein